MTRGRSKGVPAAQHPAALRGRNAKGAVRPADPRYLDDDQLDARDAYLLQETGPTAQQLVAKREELRAALDQLDDGDLVQVGTASGVEITGEGLPLYGREKLLDALAEKANTMPWADYRELLASVATRVQEKAEQPPEPDPT